jgi:predicted ATP-dependent serine protease
MKKKQLNCSCCGNKIKHGGRCYKCQDLDSNLRYPKGPDYYTHYTRLHYSVYETGNC